MQSNLATQLDLFEKNKIVNFINHTNELNFTDNQKKEGVFFTKNTSILSKLIDIISFEKTLLSKKILEPSCGNGLILLKIIEKAYLITKDKDYLYHLINDVLYFNDINQKMVEEVKNNISSLYYSLTGDLYTGKFNSYCLDFTDKNNIINEQFDYCCGNPPYLTLYGKHDKKNNEEQRINILQNYKQFPKELKNGKINYIMLFIERSLELLKSDGYLSFIVDLSFFETAFKYTRKFLLENTSIKRIEYNLQAFDGVTSGQVILQVCKLKSNNIPTLIIDNLTGTQTQINQSLWNNSTDEYKFRLNLNDNFYSRIKEKVFNENTKTLKNLYPKKNLRTCCMLLDMEDKFVYDNKNNNLFFPYYQGSKSIKDKYSIPTYNKYFYFDEEKKNKINENLQIQLSLKGIKNKKRIGFGELNVYLNPKVYIRQSSKEIIATYDENISSANNSLYVFSLKNNNQKSKDFLKFLCGYLNSTFITYYCQKENIIRYLKGKQPQIKVSDLYMIPVIIDLDIQHKIAKYVDNIYEKKDVEDSISKIDMTIFNFFKINDLEIQHIKEEIKNFTA